MTGALYGLARFCARRRFLILTLWLLVTVGLVAVSHYLGDSTNDSLTLPGTGSQHATDTLSKSFPDQANGSSPIVLHVTSGKLTDSRYSSAVNQAAADVAKAPDVASVVNPLTPQGASALSKDQATGDPAAVTEPGAEGRRGAVHVDHRPPGLRPDLGKLRAGSERAADCGGVARLTRATLSRW